MNTSPLLFKSLGNAAAPIGIFDSGVGGLSIWQAIRAQLPQESLIYVADSRYAPYGERSEGFIQGRALAISQWLIQQGVKAVVIACNTATVQAVDALRLQFGGMPSALTNATPPLSAPTLSPLPIIGVEPAIKSAAQYSKTGIAGILATSSTLRSAAFARLLAQHAGTCRFIRQAGTGLVAAIERGEIDSPALRDRLKHFLEPMLEAGADTLVLGSTHFPFLGETIHQISGSALNLIETGEPVARQLQMQLELRGLLAPKERCSILDFYTTAQAQHLQHFLHRVMGFSPSNSVVRTLELPVSEGAWSISV